MNFPSSIARYARLAQSMLSIATAPLLLLATWQMLPSTVQAQVSFNGVLTTQATGFVEPSDVAVDGSGNLYVTDLSKSTVTKLPAGGGAPVAVGSGFNFPEAVAIAAGGSIYVADTDNNAIKEIAGGINTPISRGIGFTQPFGVAVDAIGDIFVADTGNSLVKVILAGSDTPVVLGSGVAFTSPESVALDRDGNLYVADRKQSHIIELTASNGYVTAISVGSGFVSPRGVTLDAAGNVFVTDGNTLKEVTVASGLVTVVTLSTSLNFGEGMAVDRNDAVYIADENNSRIAKLAPLSVGFGAESVGKATSPLTLPFTVAAGTTIAKIAILTRGAPALDFTDAGGSTCTAQTYAATTNCTVNVKFKPFAPGARAGAVILSDANGNALANVPLFGAGSGPQATFQPGTLTQVYTSGGYASGLAVDGYGNVFASYDAAGLVEIPAGGGTPKHLGNFGTVVAAAVDGSGNVFVLASNSNGTAAAVMELLAASGYATIMPVGIQFGNPLALAIDLDQNLYVADASDSTVIEMFAASGYTTNITFGGSFPRATALALDSVGNVFVTDVANQMVREIIAASGYTTVNTVVSGIYDLSSLAVDGGDNLYVSNVGSTNVVQEFFASTGYTTNRTLSQGFIGPSALAFDSLGNLYVNNIVSEASPGQSSLLKIDLTASSTLAFSTPTEIGYVDTTDGFQTETVWNSGNQPLILANPTTGKNPTYPSVFPEDSSDTALCAAGMTLAPGSHCDVSVDFEPAATGNISTSVVITDNALNVTGATQTIKMTAVGIAATTTTTLTATPAKVVLGFPVTLTATVAAHNVTPQGTVNFLVDNKQVATATLVSGRATATINPAAGVHSVNASYVGESTYLASTSAAVTVTVAGAEMTAVSGSGQSASYGSLFAKPLVVSLKSSTGQPITGQTVTFVATGVNVSSTTAVTNAEGIASVTASATSTGSESVVAQYQSSTGAIFTLTGTKAPLTVAATNGTVSVGQPIPPLHYSVAGLVNGDSPSVITGAPVETTTAKTGSAAGTYPITIAAGTLKATNYSFVFVPATLTIAAPAEAASLTENPTRSTIAPPNY